MFRKARIKFRVLGYLNETLSTKQRAEINRIYTGMQKRIPEPVWRELPIDRIAALYVWEIVEAGIVTLDSLNLRGLHAWKLANDEAREGAQVGLEQG